jgi:hypothetical protein
VGRGNLENLSILSEIDLWDTYPFLIYTIHKEMHLMLYVTNETSNKYTESYDSVSQHARIRLNLIQRSQYKGNHAF